MSDLHAQFERAVDIIRRLPERPDNDTLLRLYSLYKQATEGDAEGPQPGFFDFIGCAKREAWEQLRGMDGGEAMRMYIELARELDTTP
jgi:diazepam-binding inhibitor (GABA receptor modulator, acyl-CoA-binding protein)